VVGQARVAELVDRRLIARAKRVLEAHDKVSEPYRTIKASLPRDQELIYPPVQAFWDAAVKGGE
jgi:hypothetical protein